MTPAEFSPSPLTDAEVAFLQQIIWEQFRLTSGPAWRWFREQELPLCELGPFSHALNREELGRFYGEVINDPTFKPPTDSFVIPWSDKADFWNRRQEVQKWLDRRAQSERDAP